jgi:site-specific DNA-cytosine methylase
MRIMGFPDSYAFPRGTPLVDRYQMVADAVSPIFSRALARAVLGALAERGQEDTWPWARSV